MAAFNGSGEPGMAGAPDLDDILAQMFGASMGGGMGGMPGMGGMGGMPGGHPNRPRKSRNEEQDYEVSLEDLYKGKTVRFTSTKNVICGHCKGKGGKEKATAKKCSTCDGHGAKEVLQQMGGFLTQQTVTCTTCKGQGSYFSPKDKCKKCKGERVTEEKKMLELYIPRGTKYVLLSSVMQYDTDLTLDKETRLSWKVRLTRCPDRNPATLFSRLLRKSTPCLLAPAPISRRRLRSHWLKP
jgi:DnaJ family protein A protein 2